MNLSGKRKKRIKWRMFNEQRGICCLCRDENRPMVWTQPESDSYATFEHLVARWWGGRDVQSNLALSHKDCNNKRGCGPKPQYARSQNLTVPFSAAWLSARGYLEAEGCPEK